MAVLASDWLRHFSTSPLKPLNGFQRNLTGSKIATSSTKFVCFGPFSKQKGPPWSIPLKGGTLYSGARYVALWASCYRVHKLISIYVNCDLDLWPLTPLVLVNMSAKFDEEAHNGSVFIVFISLFPYMSIVTLTFDLWLPKSIGFILSS